MALALTAAALALAWSGAAAAAEAQPQRAKGKPAPSLAALLAGKVAVETLSFKGGQLPVRVVRGVPRPRPPAERSERSEVVSFGPGDAERVKVLRGPALRPASFEGHSETVTFADPLLAPVTVVRGPRPALPLSPIDLFGPADAGELDRIAFAVDGIESRHGADPRMWRPEPFGPQGPMQVSAAAALDVGGGDRFDLQQNRLLGRAYLAQMYRRYGNWRDALAAYNWGPGNLDQWIAGGRNPERLPPGVAYYVARVLRDALVAAARI